MRINEWMDALSGFDRCMAHEPLIAYFPSSGYRCARLMLMYAINGNCLKTLPFCFFS